MDSSLAQEIEREMNDIKKIQIGIRQAEIVKIDAMKQDFLIKQHENEMVKKVRTRQELEEVKDDSQVYKLIGPALVPQALPEARANVEKRLEFIAKELYSLLSARLDKLHKDFVTRGEEKNNKIVKLRKDLSSARS